MFASDLTTFLEILKETRANGIIATAGADAEGPWQAQLILAEGRVTFCRIQKSVDGQLLLTDGPALRWLASQGNLPWQQITASPPQDLLPPPRGSQADPLQPAAIPQRLAVLESRGMASWSRKQRQVFGLIDGQRSIERIAMLLRQPVEVAEDIVRDLHAKGVIVVNTIAAEVGQRVS